MDIITLKQWLNAEIDREERKICNYDECRIYAFREILQKIEEDCK